MGENRIAHLGDLGCELPPEQMEKLQGLDAILIPVGGFYTIDANEAAAFVKKANPRIVIPMHYRSQEDGFGFPEIGTVDAFTEQMESVMRISSPELETARELAAQVVVLRPENIQRA